MSIIKKEKFSIIVVADTQNVASDYPELLPKTGEWIVEQSEPLNIKMVLHVGDVVNDGDASEWQWDNHHAAFDRVDYADIPMMIAIGNHDYDNLLQENRDSKAFNRHCGLYRYKHKEWFGDTFQTNRTENMYALLTINNEPYIFMSLEFAPRDEVIEWANDVLEKHHDHKAIIVTHSFLNIDGNRTQPGSNHHPHDYTGTMDGNDGQALWEKCISLHENILAVYSGHHVGGNVSHRYDKGENNNEILQSFQNWQLTEHGGEGRIRVVTFDVDGTVTHEVFNPQTNQYETKPGYTF